MGSTATLPSKSLLPLATFAHNWVGGDINGLAAFAGTLYGYVPGMEDVVTALNQQVSQIIADASWQGSAARAFTSNWEKVSAEVNAVGLIVIETGSIVDQLAADLSKIENALENAASQAAAHGVQIGADGQPPSVCYGNATQESWRAAYSTFYQRCLADANDARVQAAGDLVKLTSATTSGTSGQAAGGDPSDVGIRVGEGNTIADLLADLLATPTAYSTQSRRQGGRGRGETGPGAEGLARGANGRPAGGRPVRSMPDDVKTALAKAKGELASVETELAKAKGNENAVSKLFGTRLDDLPGVSKLADGFGDASVLSKAFDLPVVDVVAGGLSTVLNAQADVHAGVPGWVAYPLETANTVGTIALATVVGGAVAGAGHLRRRARARRGGGRRRRRRRRLRCRRLRSQFHRRHAAPMGRARRAGDPHRLRRRRRQHLGRHHAPGLRRRPPGQRRLARHHVPVSNLWRRRMGLFDRSASKLSARPRCYWPPTPATRSWTRRGCTTPRCVRGSAG